MRKTKAYLRRKERISQQADSRQSVLLLFSHGLGDVVQLGIVLKHLGKYRAKWRVDIGCSPGRGDGLSHLCNKVHHYDEIDTTNYSIVFRLIWKDGIRSDGEPWPATKVEHCLLTVFDIRPDESLLSYEYNVPLDIRKRVSQYVNKIGPYAVIHYWSDSLRGAKDMDTGIVERTTKHLSQEYGLSSVLIELSGRRNPIANGRSVFCPEKDNPLWHPYPSGHGQAVAALIQQSKLMIGIDSGPLHVAGATTTPTIGVWICTHPFHYFHKDDTTLHLLRREQEIRSRRLPSREKALRYFAMNYRFLYYSELKDGIIQAIEQKLA